MNFLDGVRLVARVIVALGVILALFWLVSGGTAGPRTGAICSDGWVSGARGSGACSHHGGVATWLHAR